MTGGLARRLWTYQAERFPLVQVVPLLVVFSAASVNVSAVLAGRELPVWWAYPVAFLLSLVLFFQMRVADEIKDADDDRRYRPERPVPRGLVTQRLLVLLATGAGAAALAAAFAWDGTVALLLLAVWLWLAAMTAEFGAPAWLKARMVLYLVSHMAIMPLIDILLTGVEWAPHGTPAPGLWLFFALSFVNGCVLEIGRKTWAPESEREGVESYSRLWGVPGAVRVWQLCVVVAATLLVGLGLVVGQVLAFGAIAAAGLIACLLVGAGFTAVPAPARARRLDHASGLWVFLCYGTAGFVPLVAG